jgi:hypothetical protein
MANYLRDGPYLASSSAERTAGIRNPGAVSTTYDGNLSSLNSYVYNEISNGPYFSLPSTAGGNWYYWFNANQDGSYSIFVDSIRVYWRYRTGGSYDSGRDNTRSITVHTYSPQEEEDITQAEEDAGVEVGDFGWVQVYNDTHSWSTNNRKTSIHFSLDIPVSKFLSGVMVQLYGSTDAQESEIGSTKVWAYNKEVEVIGAGIESGLRYYGSDGNIYRLAAYVDGEEPPTGESDALRIGVIEDEAHVVRRLRLVPEGSDASSPVYVSTLGGDYTVAAFGRYE